MWNILLTLIVIAILWMFGSNSMQSVNPVQEVKEIKQVKQEKSVADQMTRQVESQVDYARQMQQQEQENLTN